MVPDTLMCCLLCIILDHPMYEYFIYTILLYDVCLPIDNHHVAWFSIMYVLFTVSDHFQKFICFLADPHCVY